MIAEYFGTSQNREEMYKNMKNTTVKVKSGFINWLYALT